MADDTKTDTQNADADKAKAADPKLAEGDADKAKLAADASKGSEGSDADKAKAETDAAAKLEAEIEARAAKQAKKLAEKLVKDQLAAAQREAEEAAANAKRSDVEKAEAKAKKAADELAEMKATAEAAQLRASLADELMDQGLAPAAPSAREHILTAFRKHVADGKDPPDALKAVKAAEPYLFKQPAAKVEPEKKVAANTGGKQAGKDERAIGDTSAGNQNGKPTVKNPGDLTDPAEIAAAMRQKHGVSIPFN